MSHPTVSVIVPVYNTREFLSECVESILGQSFGDFELLLVDDGSIDGSREMADGFATADRRVRTMHMRNHGVSAARNAGIEAARGRWLAFVDSDDALHPRALERLLEAARQTGLSIVVGGSKAGVRPAWSASDRPLRVKTVASAALIVDTLYQSGPDCSVWGKLFHRCVFDQERFVEGLWYEDLDIFYRLYARVGKVAVTAEPLYFYRRHRGSFLNRFTPRRLDVLTVTEKIERYCADALPEALPAARDRRLSANFNMFILASRAGMADVGDRCWDVICRYRRGSLADRRVRFKNKIGALLSYGGRRAVLAASLLMKIR